LLLIILIGDKDTLKTNNNRKVPLQVQLLAIAAFECFQPQMTDA